MNKLLKDAIADAKAVRETALAQAKLALEEAFGSKIQAIASQKIKQEMAGSMDNTKMSSKMDTEEALRMQELAGLSEEEDEELADDELAGDEMGDEDMGAPDSVSVGLDFDDDGEYDLTGVVGGEEEEDIEDIEDIGDEDEDLAEILRQLEEEDRNANKYDLDSTNEAKDEENMGDENMEEEINLDELIQALKEGDEEETDEEETDEEEMMKEGDDEYSKAKDQAMDTNKGSHGDVVAERKKMKKMEEELNEAYNAVKYLRSKLSEVNLLNAKLLFVNKLFKKNGLTESQKVKIIETFDRAKNVREAKLIYATLSESFNSQSKTKKPVVENFASAPVKKTNKVITEGNKQMERFKTLAGIIKS